MKKNIRNNTIHLIPLASGIIQSFRKVNQEITPEEEKRFADKIDVDYNLLAEEGLNVEEVKETVKEEKGILNKHTVNDYMSRSTRTVVNSIEEDKSNFSESDIELMKEYETSHKKRDSVIDKLNKTGGGF